MSYLKLECEYVLSPFIRQHVQQNVFSNFVLSTEVTYKVFSLLYKEKQEDSLRSSQFYAKRTKRAVWFSPIDEVISEAGVRKSVVTIHTSASPAKRLLRLCFIYRSNYKIFSILYKEDQKGSLSMNDVPSID